MKASRKNKTDLRAFFDRPTIRAFFWIIVILAIWELASQLGFTPSYILPPFSKVIATLWNEIINGSLLIMVGRSLFGLIQAVAVSLGLSAVIIVLCLKSKTFSSLYNAIAVMMNSIPSMALLPLIIMWFGIGNSAILVLVTHSILWTFTVYILEGINSMPKIYREFSDNIELGVINRLANVYLPALLPNIVSGLKIAWGRAWRSLIGAEIVFGTIGEAGGLGYFININRLNGNMSKVLAGIIAIAAIGVIVDYGLFRRLDAKMKKWGLTHE